MASDAAFHCRVVALLVFCKGGEELSAHLGVMKEAKG
jgi:hypothetical protein